MLRAVCRFTWRPEPTAITRWCASALSSPASTEGANDGDVAWNCMSPENETRCRGMLEEPTGIYRASKAGAAVLVPLCSVGGEPALLYTLRSSELRGKHKGDVSFPGGKSDPSDRDIVHTALREAQEELGIQVMEESTWGVMKPIMDLVEDIFTLSIPHLCMENNQAYTHFRLRGRYAYTLPVFLGGKHRVWGLTAILTDSALKMLVPSTYQSKVFGTRKV
ncbi:mitochondrial coenzyme A diphosphatase NUDT8 isoform X2 [Ambystoma mexicanum]|uniref:mitochondrial coenzyme A diphosphatase NUDT8 isoform X2 n=1 Tax=Ambystoma mexicanum TaxID=8296 RepID=UPI0037E953F3